jgi:hypothetical protein
MIEFTRSAICSLGAINNPPFSWRRPMKQLNCIKNKNKNNTQVNEKLS